MHIIRCTHPLLRICMHTAPLSSEVESMLSRLDIAVVRLRASCTCECEHHAYLDADGEMGHSVLHSSTWVWSRQTLLLLLILIETLKHLTPVKSRHSRVG